MQITILILVIISLILSIIGISMVCIFKGIPESISAMVYSLKKNNQWIWSLWIFLIAILLMPYLLEITTWVGWLTITCLIGVAVTPIINEDMRNLHNILGIMSGIFSQVCVVLINPWWLFVWLLMLYAIALDFSNYDFYDVNDDDDEYELLQGKTVLISEIICMITLYGAILNQILTIINNEI